MSEDPRTRRFDALGPWLEACRAAGLAHAVLRTTDEIRAEPAKERGVTVGPVRRATLLAYDQGVLLRVVLDDPPADLGGQLRDAGLTLRVVVDHLG
ncbi:MAG: hypothetical protein H6739_02790 [Alphaproteobacteria bacterium]|nr:hypothetical protein [Alphaproteobacteria bacterium]